MTPFETEMENLSTDMFIFDPSVGGPAAQFRSIGLAMNGGGRRKSMLLACAIFSGVVPFKMAFGQAAGIAVGDSEIIPSLRLEYFSDSNVFRTEFDESDATGVRVLPKVEWLADSGTTELSASYNGDISRSGISSTDYDDHSLAFSAGTVFSKRSRARAELEFLRESTRPGVGLAIGQQFRSSILNSQLLSASHTYGAVGARGNVFTGLRLRNVTYSGAGVSDGSDYVEVSPVARFSLRMSGSTRSFVELRYRNLDYESDDADRDQINAFVGLSWADTERFGATAKVGILSYDYSISDSRDGNDLGLSISGFYRPVSYSKFELSVDREVFDLNDSLELQAEEASIEDSLTLSWIHNWSSRLSHRGEFGVEIVERGCSSDNQITTRSSLSVLLQLKRWISGGVRVALENRDYNGCDSETTVEQELDFEKQAATLFVEVSL